MYKYVSFSTGLLYFNGKFETVSLKLTLNLKGEASVEIFKRFSWKGNTHFHYWNTLSIGGGGGRFKLIV
jgi:hypothetical protein